MLGGRGCCGGDWWKENWVSWVGDGICGVEDLYAWLMVLVKGGYGMW
jgi:hypothetical protein